MNIKKVVVLGVALSSLMLTACGGGGESAAATATTATGGNTSPRPSVVVSTAEGAYKGTFVNGYEHFTFVLDDGRYYSMHGTSTGTRFTTNGFLQGSGVSNNGSFSSFDTHDYFGGGQILTGALNASYSASSISGTLTEGAFAVGFDGTTNIAFNYNSPANLSSIRGLWKITSIENEAISMNIEENGSFLAFLGTCSISGTITPRPSGKNIFNVNQTFGATCPLADQSTSGIAVTYPLSNNKQQLLVFETTASRANGILWFGER